jgi:hypothetical protein
MLERLAAEQLLVGRTLRGFPAPGSGCAPPISTG